MNLALPSRGFSAARFWAYLGIAAGLLFLAAPRAAAAIINTQGSATTTITSLVFNADGTISIEADQVGTLSKIGAFTGHLSYIAVPTPTALILVGSGTLRTASGEQIFLKARILELGTGYPYLVNGVLAVAGGTGRYAGASGALAVSGTDEEALTDTLQLQGAVVTR